ncbi:hypothetical protein UFOVP219_50 [uncultured Caudovirales phage]|uniref:Uncharacterized protein n=1 Tax=uncultured Caudovirales phage TaxID=2100421 RepID=A0A6J7WLG1_9CAUD|nr:hypothetical protein UFOVP219_50 [uncultured Caudovirales phage]
MANPAKPLEQKRALGNPGQRKLPDVNSTVSLSAGRVEPHQPLDWAGMLLWNRVFGVGQTWISPQSDVELLLLTCKQLDRQVLLEQAFVAKPDDFHIHRQLLDLESAIVNNLGKLGLTVDARSKLGLAEIKAETKMEQLRNRQREREQVIVVEQAE